MSGTVDRKDIEVRLREALNEVMHHQFTHSRPAMNALQVLIDEATEAADELDRLRQALSERSTFAGWFREVPSAMSHRLWEQGGAEQRPGDVALYEIGRR